MVRQQIARNFGVALRPEEEMLRSQLDAIQSQLSSPQFAVSSYLLGALMADGVGVQSVPPIPPCLISPV